MAGQVRWHGRLVDGADEGLEEENRRLKKLYVEVQIKADIVAEALAKKL
jgi:hypothetical protein